MIHICKKNRVKLMYAEDWCFAPALVRTQQIIEEGALGDILYVKAKEVHSGTHSPYAKDKKTCGGGSLIHLAVHPIGWLLCLLGDGGKNGVVEVIGKTNEGGKDNYVHKENSGEDWAVGIIKFESGAHGFVEGNYITVGGMDDKVEIYGTEGVMKVDLTFSSPINVYSRRGYTYAIEKADNTLGWTRPAVDEFYNLGYVNELEHFVDCVLMDEPPMWGVDGETGLWCLRIVDAMYRSSREGRTVRTEP
jgi:predicted dehydrogenase